MKPGAEVINTFGTELTRKRGVPIAVVPVR